ncbi:MAG: NrfD/PsrC family molybdoenzyme membrane anchor subunit [Gemmatimonadota bacterium]
MTTMTTPAPGSWSIQGRGVRTGLWALWIGLFILGAIGVYLRFTQGHLPAGYGSYVPWGLWVALYFHGVGIAGGAFVLGAGGYILDLPGFRSRRALRTVIVLSVAAIIPAFMGVWLDLGHMERAHRIFTSPAFTSMMAFNAWMYNIFTLCAVVAWLLSFRDDREWLKPVLFLALVFSVLFPSQSGAFFGVVDAKAYWHSALLPMVFLTSAITAGAATLLLVRMLTRADESAEEHEAAVRRLRLITIVGLCVYFVFEFAEFSIALWNPISDAPAVELVLWGPYWWVFWIVHLAIGGVVSLILLASRRPRLWAAGALLVAITFVSARLNVLIPGQAVAEIQGLQEAFSHERLRYIYRATPMEYLVGLFLLAVGMAVFYIGRKINRAVETRSATNTRGAA